MCPEQRRDVFVLISMGFDCKGGGSLSIGFFLVFPTVGYIMFICPNNLPGTLCKYLIETLLVLNLDSHLVWMGKCWKLCMEDVVCGPRVQSKTCSWCLFAPEGQTSQDCCPVTNAEVQAERRAVVRTSGLDSAWHSSHTYSSAWASKEGGKTFRYNSINRPQSFLSSAFVQNCWVFK